MTRRGERGSTAFELPLILGLILIPFGLLVITIPTWVERQAAARDAAGELARSLVVEGGPSTDLIAAIEEGYQLPPGTLRPFVSGDSVPGHSVTVEVAVSMPAVELPVFGSFGHLSWTASHTERYPDYAEGGAP